LKFYRNHTRKKKKGYIQRIIGKIFGSLFRSEQKSQQIEKVEEIRREKYTQISDRVFEFLTSGAFNNLPENEKEIILFYLLTSPSPREQDKILNSLSFLFKNHESLEIKDLEALEIEKTNLDCI
jgi:predicted nucleotide-binding protein (sugar kinase/HSP70/actin superfamily)